MNFNTLQNDYNIRYIVYASLFNISSPILLFYCLEIIAWKYNKCNKQEQNQRDIFKEDGKSVSYERPPFPKLDTALL